MRRTALVGLVLMVGAGVGVSASTALAAPAGGGTVYIATGENFPDAVAAGAAGGAADGPVLLVHKHSLPVATLAEVNRLQPGTIVIVGGTGVITIAVENQFKALSFGPLVVRYGGADRYETAALLSAASFPKIGAASCPGIGFFPTSSATSYIGSETRWFNGAGGASFYCEVSLPHGATVTKLSAGLDDTGSFNGGCALMRINIVGGGIVDEIGQVDIMAVTSITSGTPGKVPVSTTDISNPSVINFRYGYYFLCGTGNDLQIIGATAHYELTG